MIIKCGVCGKDMELPGEISEGQHVRCPFCGEKSEYKKPVRIELPSGLSSRKRIDNSNQAVNAEKSKDEPSRVEEVKPTEKKPLHIIRSQNEVPAPENLEAKRRLYMAEEHVRFYEEMKNMEQRRKNWGKISSIVMLVALVGAIFGTYVIIQNRTEKKRQAEVAHATEMARIAAERAEQERQERVKREAEEKAARERRIAEENERREKQKLEQEKLRAERMKEQNAIHEAKVLYKKTIALFRDGEFDFMKALPKKTIPGKSEGEFFYMLPFLENAEIVVCNSTTNGIESVYRLNCNGERTPLDAEGFLASLDGKDYLVATEENVYFQSKRKKPHIGQISKKEVVDLSKEFFGDMAQEVKQFDLDPDELKFEIVFIPKDSKKIVISETIEYGASYSLDKVRDAVEDAIPMMSSVTSSYGRKKRFKRTVVIWDGAHIKKGVDGVTYVPRVAPLAASDYNSTTLIGPGWDRRREWRNRYKHERRAAYTREQWQALYDEAIRQDQQEREFYERQSNAQREKAQRVLSQAERDYAERIDKIMNEGTLYFRAKIDNGKK